MSCCGSTPQSQPAQNGYPMHQKQIYPQPNGPQTNGGHPHQPQPQPLGPTAPPIQRYEQPKPIVMPVYPPPTANTAEIAPVPAALVSREGRMSVGIDFGTTFSGVAYGSSRHFSGQIRTILAWPGTEETYRKIPTVMLYRVTAAGVAEIVAWGVEAKRHPMGPNLVKCEWFKLYLASEGTGERDLPFLNLPPGKKPADVIVDFLSCLWQYAKKKITQETGSVADVDAASVVLTVPAAWNAPACAIMREAAIRAQLVASSKAGDTGWRDRLHIITEPEAASVHAAATINDPVLSPPNSFVLVDCGGGTIDTAAYKIIGHRKPLELAELAVRTGDNCGSIFIDRAFDKFLHAQLKNHPSHLEPASLASFMQAFSEVDKVAYKGSERDDETNFRYYCLDHGDDHDPAVGLEFGELVVPGLVLRNSVFAPTVASVTEVVARQLLKLQGKPINALIIVGGFGTSDFLLDAVQRRFGGQVGKIMRVDDCDSATLQGAARYGLQLNEGTLSVLNVICPKSYLMKVRLPAEEHDKVQRPAYITTNDAHVDVCDNRLLYLAHKGAMLRKRQRLEASFCKFARSVTDSAFTATLLVSDEDVVRRYTDEAATQELCKWTVDLGNYPPFQQHFQRSPQGAYIDFKVNVISAYRDELVWKRALGGNRLGIGVLLGLDGNVYGSAIFDYIGR